ncbi:MAG TPA: hypothetical protein VK437_17990 [Steroidobacteraceae bacterium]|nr:hypothetical protein [Steroidobacteraceae bacterium]
MTLSSLLRLGWIGASLSAAAFAASSVEDAEAPAPAASAPAAQERSAAAQTLELTNGSGGKTFSASIGTRVEVRLSGALRWSQATTDPASAEVLAKQSGRTQADGSSVTVFLVTHGGTAGLSATGRANCPPGRTCPLFVLRWHVSISVPDG